MKKTSGDSTSVKCPACGSKIDWLWETDEDLDTGETFNCHVCGREITILSVQRYVDLILGYETT